MSDIADPEGTSRANVAAATSSSAGGEDVAAARWEARLWAASCALASLGAVVFGLSTWVPWVTVTGYGRISIVNGRQEFYRFLLDPADIQGSFGLFGGSLLSVAGLLLLAVSLATSLTNHQSARACRLLDLGHIVDCVCRRQQPLFPERQHSTPGPGSQGQHRHVYLNSGS